MVCLAKDFMSRKFTSHETSTSEYNCVTFQIVDGIFSELGGNNSSQPTTV